MINAIKNRLAGAAGKRQLPLKTKLIFAWGDIFAGGSVNLISFFYLIFLTDVVKLSPALAGTAIMVSKIWDAVTDPVMGAITDHTRSRWGKRRPYFFLAFFTVFIAWVLLWNPINFSSVSLRFAYVLFSFLFYNTVSTMVLVPYVATQPLLTSDYDERTVINLIRMIFSFGGTVIGAILFIMIPRLFPDIRTGHRVNSLIMAFLFALPWLVIALHIKEPDSRKDPPPPPFRWGDFIAPLKLKTFRYMIGIYLCSLLSMDVVMALTPYFLSYVRTNPLPDMRIIVVFTGIACLILFPLSYRIARSRGKERVFIISALLFVAGMAVFTFADDLVNPWLSLLITIPGTLGILGCTIYPWTMFPDATDVGKLAWGYSRSGSFGGLMTLFRKLSSALAIFLVGHILSLAGYQPAAETAGAVQPPTVVLTIRLLIFAFPLVILTLGIFLAWRYPLKVGVFRRLTDFLENRNKQEASPIEEELKKILI